LANDLHVNCFRYKADRSADIAGLLESRRTDMQNLLSEWEEVSQTIEANR